MKFRISGSVIVKLVAAGMLIVALGRHSYAFYTLLRWVVCGVSAFGAFRAVELRKSGWGWLLGAFALLFNPVIPTHLSREIWSILDIATAVTLLASIITIDRHYHERHS